MGRRKKRRIPLVPLTHVSTVQKVYSRWHLVRWYYMGAVAAVAALLLVFFGFEEFWKVLFGLAVEAVLHHLGGLALGVAEE